MTFHTNPVGRDAGCSTPQVKDQLEHGFFNRMSDKREKLPLAILIKGLIDTHKFNFFLPFWLIFFVAVVSTVLY